MLCHIVEQIDSGAPPELFDEPITVWMVAGGKIHDSPCGSTTHIADVELEIAPSSINANQMCAQCLRNWVGTLRDVCDTGYRLKLGHQHLHAADPNWLAYTLTCHQLAHLNTSAHPVTAQLVNEMTTALTSRYRQQAQANTPDRFTWLCAIWLIYPEISAASHPRLRTALRAALAHNMPRQWVSHVTAAALEHAIQVVTGDQGSDHLVRRALADVVDQIADADHDVLVRVNNPWWIDRKVRASQPLLLSPARFNFASTFLSFPAVTVLPAPIARIADAAGADLVIGPVVGNVSAHQLSAVAQLTADRDPYDFHRVATAALDATTSCA